MKILVIGSGGREHALVWKLAQSSLVDKIYAAPGNPGIAELAECIPIKSENTGELIKFANDVDIVVVGPETPLAEGIVDELPKNKAFGPTKRGAMIESDKSYSKEIMRNTNIPTADFETFYKLEAAQKFIKSNRTYPIVIKASGLAAGKGVIIAETEKEANTALSNMMSEKTFGEAGDKVVIEEYLEGEEVSVLAFTDGKDFIPLIPSQDHKKLMDGDNGLNTGGMGAYARAVLTEKEVGNIVENVFAPCVWGMKKDGITYKGILYAGLMMTSIGPKVLEFNCRFGDPETQVILPLIDSDLMEPILATIEGNLKSVKVKFKNEYAICVVLASSGYPGNYEKGKEITGLSKVPTNGCIAFHAGTSMKNNKIITAGGRVMGITGLGNTLKASKDNVYSAISKVYFEGMYYRKDVGDKGLD